MSALLGSALLGGGSGGVDPVAVQAAVDAIVAGAPAALDTLNELAAALGDDQNFAASVTTALAGKADAAAMTTALAAKMPIAGGAFTGRVAVAEVPLTDAATIATNAALGNVFRVTLGGNRTLGNPTNMVAGDFMTWRITQDGTGGRTLAFGAAFKWSGGSAPTLTATAGATDVISGYCNGTTIDAAITRDVR
jgi:hypothetical protein